MLGDPYLEILAPIYKEFQRWRIILRQEFQAHLAHKHNIAS
jgi:sRNA-binding regulator protein Hfq